MLRRDTKARFVGSGCLWLFKFYQFQSGRQLGKTLSQEEYQQLLQRQEESPVVVLDDPDRRRTWWMFKGEFYSEDDDLEEQEVKALILQRLRKKDKRIERALTLMEQQDLASSNTREPIPDDVKVFVWNRDGGRCVKCGSQENLEFDHIIPVAKGGSNTARNIQLLCETCNRSKGDSLI